MVHEATVIIPMAGSGSRFKNAGYMLPKPLIDVHGRPMISHVIDNIHLANARLILLARRADAEAYPEIFRELSDRYHAHYVLIDQLTEGAACTVLQAVAHINNDKPLLIANSDQLVDFSADEFVKDAAVRGLAGSILTFAETAGDPKWSYARLNEKNLVTETREKRAISNHATVGIYWFAEGRFFVEAAAEMIARNDRCNNEFYICPSYNYLIKRQLGIGIYEVDARQMHGLGTPEDLAVFLAQSSPV